MAHRALISPVSLFAPVLLVVWQLLVNTVIRRTKLWRSSAAWVIG